MPVVWAVAGISTGGVSTLSITWIKPLLVTTSVMVTLAPPSETPLASAVIFILSPLAISASIPSVIALAGTSDATTW